jgi:hypothetical protein
MALNRYNTREHITAGELRQLGFYVAENVDNAAYVRRVAVGFRNSERLCDGSPTAALDLLEPFTSESVHVEHDELVFAI